MENDRIIWMDTKLSKPVELPPEMPPQVQGVLLGLVFGLCMFGDAIIGWLA